MSITVNIMSYRYGHLVSQCVDSILSQTKKADVIRVYDDGIGDCGHVKDLYPGVELIERKKNMGTAKNFQDAMKIARTGYKEGTMIPWSGIGGEELCFRMG